MVTVSFCMMVKLEFSCLVGLHTTREECMRLFVGVFTMVWAHPPQKTSKISILHQFFQFLNLLVSVLPTIHHTVTIFTPTESSWCGGSNKTPFVLHGLGMVKNQPFELSILGCQHGSAPVSISGLLYCRNLVHFLHSFEFRDISWHFRDIFAFSGCLHEKLLDFDAFGCGSMN